MAWCCKFYPAKSLNGASSRILNGPGTKSRLFEGPETFLAPYRSLPLPLVPHLVYILVYIYHWWKRTCRAARRAQSLWVCSRPSRLADQGNSCEPWSGTGSSRQKHPLLRAKQPLTRLGHEMKIFLEGLWNWICPFNVNATQVLKMFDCLVEEKNKIFCLCRDQANNTQQCKLWRCIKQER